MKTVKLKYLCLSILICVFVTNLLMSVSTAQINLGIERMKTGIENYENGNYDDAIFNLEMAIYQIPAEEKDQLWDAHLYLGLSYLLLGDAEESEKEFNKAQDILKNKIPDPYAISPKVIKLFKELLKQKIILEINGIDAQGLYKKYCIICHGEDGKGKSDLGEGLGARDFTDKEFQDSITDEKILEQIENGREEKMFPFKEKLTVEEMKALIPVIRAFE